jgi:hypothetical protein
MDSKNIEQLLDKYWNCETTLEEEEQLRAFFSGGGVPDSMKETAELFRFFYTEQKRAIIQENFEPAVTKQLKTRRGGKMISMISFTNIARIAAGLLVVVAATFFIRQEVRKAYPPATEDTYTDPQVAFEETKKALMMISNSFGKAKKEASKMKIFNEAEKKIQGKTTDKENVQL